MCQSFKMSALSLLLPNVGVFFSKCNRVVRSSWKLILTFHNDLQAAHAQISTINCKSIDHVNADSITLAMCITIPLNIYTVRNCYIIADNSANIGTWIHLFLLVYVQHVIIKELHNFICLSYLYWSINLCRLHLETDITSWLNDTTVNSNLIHSSM